MGSGVTSPAFLIDGRSKRSSYRTYCCGITRAWLCNTLWCNVYNLQRPRHLHISMAYSYCPYLFLAFSKWNLGSLQPHLIHTVLATPLFLVIRLQNKPSKCISVKILLFPCIYIFEFQVQTWTYTASFQCVCVSFIR